MFTFALTVDVAQRVLQILRRPEDLLLFNGDDSAFLAVLVHRCVADPLGQTEFGDHPWPAGTALLRGRGGHTERGLDRRRVRRKLIAGHERRGPIAQPCLRLLDDQFGVLERPRPGNYDQDQPVLRVVGHEIPVVAALVVVGVVRITVLLLLAHERPLLVELDLAGRWGKKPRPRRGCLWRADRPGVPAG